MEKDLRSQEAQNKLKELAESIRICMFATTDTTDDKYGRPMSTMQVDDDGAIWFFTKDNSKVSDDARKNEQVTLYYSHPGKNSYLTVQGSVELVKDRKKMEELYTPIIKGWFPEGLDDPNIVLLKVTPQQAHYWDADAAKLVVLFSMIQAAVTGKPSDLGKSGDLKI